jgi:acyl carrier protein
VAYVVKTDGAALAEPELLRFLQEKLPPYMVPSAIVQIGSLPLTVNGKVDRSALPSPRLGRESRRRPYVAPRTRVQQVLADVWGEILGVDSVGMEDDFYGLGGHSLHATQIASRLNESLGIDLPLRTFFEMPRFNDLANAIKQLLGTAPMPQGPIIKRARRLFR